MKTTYDFFKVTAMILVLFTFVACSDDDDDDDGPDEILITQTQLNNADNFLMEVTGGSRDVDIPHNGTSEPTDATIRRIYASLNNLSGTIQPGTIVTKKTHAKKEDNSLGDLQVAFAMVKREPGYDSDNGDWEYMMIPFDATNDYGTQPFGNLPAVNAEGRGKMNNCIGCHAKAGGNDYLFVND